MTGSGPILVAMQPVLQSDGEGPVRGSIIIGRFLTSELIERFRQQSQIDLHIDPVWEENKQLKKQVMLEKLGV
ncbi:hypothetical protein BGC07_02525 [Piscirickettsia litoralis]|uniref:CHASE4 domain-containing protein n=2 Tax=Piscirickettsia litoralis TaxID=1891921 RepID=A0ABX3A1D7_9GAMM|nr:CHASE4 domain-containing protein [Piscirickettsia litoralis]ODN42037.1 hypothetical protein BGC07_02525 [Piscirickettsia litoralis]